MRDVVRIHQTMPEKLFHRLPKNRELGFPILNPRLIAFEHMRLILVFDEEHDMTFDYDYDFDTQIIHVEHDGFNCDMIFRSREEDLAIKLDVLNAEFKDEEIKTWFYMPTKKLDAKTYGKDKYTRNYYGLGVHFLALNNFVCCYGLENVFDVEEKIAKPQQNTHRTGKRKKNNVVRLYKCYTLKKDWEQAKRLKKPIQYVCGAWGVRGHMRKCPNGGYAYVRPYVKGKNRDNYVGKEYLLISHNQRKERERKNAIHPKTGESRTIQKAVERI